MKQNPPPAKPAGDKSSLRERVAAASEASEKVIRARPAAPWDPFPLSELAIFIGLVCLVTGAIVGGDTGIVIVGVGIGLACLGGLENALREHFAGYRSHAALLAGVVFLVVLITGTLAIELNPPARLALSIGIAAIVFFALRRAFLARSGGKPF